MSAWIDPQSRYGSQYYDYAMSFRALAIAIDELPNSIEKYNQLPAIQFLLNDRESNVLQRTQYLEAFSYGDPGVLLASPGPSLSGLMLRELGSPQQIDYFYSLLQSQSMRTFFALTEPDKGSDANLIKTILEKNSEKNAYILNGEKCFCGNGAVAEMGVVIAKIGSTPAGMRAVWLPPVLLKQKGVLRENLPMFSLRGAQIAHLQFNDCAISDEFILGKHKPASQRGLLGIIKVFNQLRTGVGAIAIGHAQAVYDLFFEIYKNYPITKSLDFLKLNSSLDAARDLLKVAAQKVSEDPMDGTGVSIAKMNATQTAEKVVTFCIHHAQWSHLIEYPWLLKAYRDVFCWEYMEGTSQIQRNHVIRAIKESCI